MVLESLINSIKAEKKPVELLLLGFIYVIVAAILSLWIFPSQASMVFVFLTTLATIPILYGIIVDEEKKDLDMNITEKDLLKEHAKALKAFMYLFFGMVVGILLMYVLLPSTTVYNLFTTQIQTISSMNHAVDIGISGQFTGSLNSFSKIFLNNMKVLIFCILFSFLYGMGAIFILTWNASVIGVAIGNFIRTNLASISHLVGLEKGAQYFNIISVGLLKYAIHGIPEILAYFIAGLAGGIISVAIIKKDLNGRKFEHILLDSADLLLLSIFVILIAAVLEVWVTPLIFN